MKIQPVIQTDKCGCLTIGFEANNETIKRLCNEELKIKKIINTLLYLPCNRIICLAISIQIIRQTSWDQDPNRKRPSKSRLIRTPLIKFCSNKLRLPFLHKIGNKIQPSIRKRYYLQKTSQLMKQILKNSKNTSAV